MLVPGDPIPWFTARSSINPAYPIADAAGRFLVLTFFNSSSDPASRRILDDIEKQQYRFDVENVCFFGISTDPNDELPGRLQLQFPGVFYFWDSDRSISRIFGAEPSPGSPYRTHSLVLDPTLRVIAVLSSGDQPEEHVGRIVQFLDTLPPIRSLTGFAPILVVPWILEPELCRTLIAQHEQHGGTESGFMRDVDGKTVRILDARLKRRTDYHLTDAALIESVLVRIRRRLLPEIKKVFQFEVTRIESMWWSVTTVVPAATFISTATTRRWQPPTGASQ